MLHLKALLPLYLRSLTVTLRTQTSVWVFLCPLLNNVSNPLSAIILLFQVSKSRLIRYINEIRQALRQYIELCLNTRTLTQLGLQVPIKTIRQ